ncbi:hypothetical protein [Moorena sp. SIO4G3]|uniref:hypothetical protein n=1 Tax=Moorena sp. SIO4G3 TaxID=2607821 RepID=UPI00142AA9EA|nr:hypothetical protein [Moorena sp. SIO4G3]NEO74944.1 hypothetical protein [Moorena sp. SIO4G3]
MGETPVRPLHRFLMPHTRSPHPLHPTPEVKVKNLPLWGDGEMGEIFIKRCSAVLGVSPTRALHQDRVIIPT